jgi:hypothetical protein
MDSTETRFVDASRRLPLNPYPGLKPFESEYKPFFFGRDQQITEVVERLQSNHMAAILGGSGCGKSSLILAGVLPTLMQTAGAAWRPLIFRPEESPIRNLAREFRTWLDLTVPDAPSLEDVYDVLRQRDGLSELVRLFRTYGRVAGSNPCLRDRTNLLIIVDQFEEIFRPRNRDSAEVETLVDLILDAFTNPQSSIYVILTMRSEDLHGCAAFLGLPEALNCTSYLVPRLRDTQLREVITEPARMYAYRRRIEMEEQSTPPPDVPNLQFEDEVWQEIVEETLPLKDDPDHLPLLQHLLFHLWNAALKLENKQPGEVPARITRAALDAVVAPAQATPGHDALLERAFDSRCEELLSALDERGQNAAKQILPLMGVVDTHGVYKRDFTTDSDIKSTTGLDDDVIQAVISTFAEPHPYLRRGKEKLDVSHEAFIRKWKRFSDWVSEDYRRANAFDSLYSRFLDWRNVLSGQKPVLGKWWGAWHEMPVARELRRLEPNSKLRPAEVRRWMSQLGMLNALEGVEFDRMLEELRQFVRLGWVKARLTGVLAILAVILLSSLLGYAYYGEKERALLGTQLFFSQVSNIGVESMQTLYSRAQVPVDVDKRLAPLWEVVSTSRALQGRLLSPSEAIGNDEQRSTFVSLQGDAEETSFDFMKGAISQYLWPLGMDVPVSGSSGKVTRCTIDGLPLLSGSLTTSGAQSVLTSKNEAYLAVEGASTCSVTQRLTNFPPGSVVKVDPGLKVLAAKVSGNQTWQWVVYLLYLDPYPKQPGQALVLPKVPVLIWPANQDVNGEHDIRDTFQVRYEAVDDHEYRIRISDEQKSLVFTGMRSDLVEVTASPTVWNGQEKDWKVFQELELGKEYCGVPRQHDLTNYCLRMQPEPCDERAPQQSRCLRFEVKSPSPRVQDALERTAVATVHYYEQADPEMIAIGTGSKAGWFRVKTNSGKELKGVWTAEALLPFAKRLLQPYSSDCNQWKIISQQLGQRYRLLLALKPSKQTGMVARALADNEPSLADDLLSDVPADCERQLQTVLH